MPREAPVAFGFSNKQLAVIFVVALLTLLAARYVAPARFGLAARA